MMSEQMLVRKFNRKERNLLRSVLDLKLVIRALGGEYHELERSEDDVCVVLSKEGEANVCLVLDSVFSDASIVDLEIAQSSTDISLVFLHGQCYQVNTDILSEIEAQKLIQQLHAGEIREPIKYGDTLYWAFPTSAYIHSGVWLYLGYGDFSMDPGGWDSCHQGCLLVSTACGSTMEDAFVEAEYFLDEYNAILSGFTPWYLIDREHLPIRSASKLIEALAQMSKDDMFVFGYNSLQRVYNDRAAAEEALALYLMHDEKAKEAITTELNESSGSNRRR